MKPEINNLKKPKKRITNVAVLKILILGAAIIVLMLLGVLYLKYKQSHQAKPKPPAVKYIPIIVKDTSDNVMLLECYYELLLREGYSDTIYKGKGKDSNHWYIGRGHQIKKNDPFKIIIV